ncbi:ABC transporter substrate-binding protein [Acrocarpospora macrocephala]|uniref:Iron ABC transporter substrate-binding protein n=1 Tax=Acrocarpospora macrocephala TaxID=150177 RepID=A0A5M3WQI8_9ACTN|nr:extracellular solute-binding protein [Acrocarpospora macrocephala]GES10840.1 iron ABC transporter substrate-binding protein [Acrocarpospora macrocephala]
MRRTAFPPLALAATLTLAACGSSAGDTAATTPTATANVGRASAVTPVDDATLKAARAEGEVLLYTNAEEQQMAPVVKAFEKAYPGITLRSLALGNQEMFQRYETEAASGTSSADVIMSSDAVGWLSFIRNGNIEDYTDPNTPNLPGHAVLGPGVYAMSVDPVIAVFNKALLPEAKQPTTMVELAAMARQLDGKIGTTDISNVIQFGATSAYLGKYGEAGWDTLEKIGAHAAVESSNGPLVTKLAQGQYAAEFFVSGNVRAFITGDVAKVVNYSYLKDGTPLLPRAIGVTAKAGHPNAAKVFVNWLLSVEGQEAACQGGFTPYRDGVTCDFGLPQVKAAVGEDNLIIATFAPKLADERDQIVARFNKAFGR